MRLADSGYFELEEAAKPGDRYFYIVDGQKPVPDPVSRFLPEGVHGATEIVDPENFQWTDRELARHSVWRGSLLRVAHRDIYRGRDISSGDCEAAVSEAAGRDDDRDDAGVRFPGTRNWGYDGVSPYSVQNELWRARMA